MGVRALKMMVVPMVFTSMIISTAGMGGTGNTPRMSKMAMRFYLSTTFIACLEGVIFFNMFRGAFQPLHVNKTTSDTEPAQLILDTVISFGDDIVVDNLFDAFAQFKLLGVMTFAIAFGIFLSRSPSPHARQLVDLCDIIFETIIAMIKAIILFTPIGVWSLIGRSITRANNFPQAMANTVFVVVVLGQLTHVLRRLRGPLRLLRAPEPVRVLPRPHAHVGDGLWDVLVGGDALDHHRMLREEWRLEGGHQLCAAHRVHYQHGRLGPRAAHRRPMDRLRRRPARLRSGPARRCAHCTALLSIGGSPIPSAGVSTLLVMVEGAGIPITAEVEQYISFALAIEWLFDSIRTTVNVTGDSVGVAIIGHLIPPPDETKVIAASMRTSFADLGVQLPKTNYEENGDGVGHRVSQAARSSLVANNI